MHKEELERICNAQKPMFGDEFLSKDIILYGAGSLGNMAMNLFGKKEIKPKFIVDKSAIGEINGVKIISPLQITDEDKQNAIFLICISTISYTEIECYLQELGVKNIMHFYTFAYLKIPELLENGWLITDLTLQDKEEIEKICDELSHDKTSIAHYLQFLWWKLRLKEVITEPVLSGKKYFKSPIFPKLGENEVLIDGGAHFGQAIKSFIEFTGGKFKKIYAFEPDEENSRVLRESFQDERIIFSSNALYNKNAIVNFKDNLGFASKIDERGDKNVKTVTIDSLNIEPTIIKLHLEGCELMALEGAQHTIQRCRPILMVFSDHNSDGLYKIPSFLYNLDDYNLYFNLHDYCGNSAIFYAIPKEKVKK